MKTMLSGKLLFVGQRGGVGVCWVEEVVVLVCVGWRRWWCLCVWGGGGGGVGVSGVEEVITLAATSEHR